MTSEANFLITSLNTRETTSLHKIYTECYSTLDSLFMQLCVTYFYLKANVCSLIRLFLLFCYSLKFLSVLLLTWEGAVNKSRKSRRELLMKNKYLLIRAGQLQLSSPVEGMPTLLRISNRPSRRRFLLRRLPATNSNFLANSHQNCRFGMFSPSPATWAVIGQFSDEWKGLVKAVPLTLKDMLWTRVKN